MPGEDVQEDEELEQAPVRTSRLLLDPRIRIALGLLGLALLGIAAYVVVANKDSTATAALAGAGLVLFVFAAQGTPIRRVKKGDLEVELLDEAKAEAERGNTERAKELVGAVLTYAGLAPQVSVESSGRLHELAVMNALQRIVPAKSELKITATPVDGKVIVRGKTIGVETRLGLKTIDRVAARLTTRRNEGKLDIDGLLVIAKGRGSEERVVSAEELLQKALEMPVRVVRWRQGDSETRSPHSRRTRCPRARRRGQLACAGKTSQRFGCLTCASRHTYIRGRERVCGHFRTAEQPPFSLSADTCQARPERGRPGGRWRGRCALERAPSSA